MKQFENTVEMEIPFSISLIKRTEMVDKVKGFKTNSSTYPGLPIVLSRHNTQGRLPHFDSHIPHPQFIIGYVAECHLTDKKEVIAKVQLDETDLQVFQLLKKDIYLLLRCNNEGEAVKAYLCEDVESLF